VKKSPWICTLLFSTLTGLSAVAAEPFERDNNQFRKSHVYQDNGLEERYGLQQDTHRQVTYAKVISAKPIVEIVKEYHPVRICREGVAKRRIKKHDKGAQLFGGLVGAVIGHNIGKRSDAKVAGAAIGAAIGSSIGKEATTKEGIREHATVNCQTEERLREFERTNGYRVTYQYQGKRYTTEMPYDPGKKLELELTVRPMIDND